MTHYIDPAPATLLPLESGTFGEFPDGPLSVRRTVLPSGVRVLTEAMPGVRSATVGLWMPVGSRDESSEQGGAAHFLEHLLFKGTRARTALQIATSFDEVGGESNAATAKESTHYYARVLDDDLAMATSVLVDMVTSSTLESEDIETERGVILDELAMSEDSPQDVVHDAFFAAAFGDSALGRPIGGTPETVKATSANQIRELYSDKYVPPSLTVVCAGNVDHEAFCGLVSGELEKAGWMGASLAGYRRGVVPGGFDAPTEKVLHRDSEQAHVLVGGRWLPNGDPRRPVSTLLTTVLGGGTSSRLFQEIREKRGLAYTAYAFEMGMSDCGLFGMYAGCTVENLAEIEKIMWGEVERLAGGDLSEDELSRARGQLRGGVALGLEDSASRMTRLGRAELSGKFTSVDGVLSRFDVVSVDDVTRMAAELLGCPRARAAVLPFE